MTTDTVFNEAEPLIQTLKPETRPNNTAVNDAASSILDIWKGLFVPFMLTEHTRSSLHVGVDSGLLLFVSQVACALDMTTFSTAYGFACYRQYFSNNTRSLGETATRMLRSGLLIYGCGIMMNIFFALQVLSVPPSFKTALDIFTLRVIYWDFIYTFLILLIGGCAITGPTLALMQRVDGTWLATGLKLAVFAILLGAPLYMSNEPFNVDCSTQDGRAKALIFGCKKMEFTATRFPAMPYFFFFNLGCILSMAVKEADAGYSAWLSALKRGDVHGVFKPTFVLYFVSLGAVFVSELWFSVPLFKNASVSWEELTPTDISGYRRYPMNFRLAFGWGFLSVIALLVAITVHFSSSLFTEIYERLGANVLIHLTMNALMIHGFFGIHKWNINEAENRNTIVFGLSFFTIAATQLLIYLARSARK
jgi:hypothetical protein